MKNVGILDFPVFIGVHLISEIAIVKILIS